MDNIKVDQIDLDEEDLLFGIAKMDDVQATKSMLETTQGIADRLSHLKPMERRDLSPLKSINETKPMTMTQKYKDLKRQEREQKTTHSEIVRKHMFQPEEKPAEAEEKKRSTSNSN